MTLTVDQKRKIRTMLGARANCPVYVFIYDGLYCKLTGKTFHWETKGGQTVHNPKAYAKKGWSNIRYVPSTIEINVSTAWIQANFGEVK